MNKFNIQNYSLVEKKSLLLEAYTKASRSWIDKLDISESWVRRFYTHDDIRSWIDKINETDKIGIIVEDNFITFGCRLGDFMGVEYFIWIEVIKKEYVEDYKNRFGG